VDPTNRPLGPLGPSLIMSLQGALWSRPMVPGTGRSYQWYEYQVYPRHHHSGEGTVISRSVSCSQLWYKTMLSQQSGCHRAANWQRDKDQHQQHQHEEDLALALYLAQEPWEFRPYLDSLPPAISCQESLPILWNPTDLSRRSPVLATVQQMQQRYQTDYERVMTMVSSSSSSHNNNSHHHHHHSVRVVVLTL